MQGGEIMSTASFTWSDDPTDFYFPSSLQRPRVTVYEGNGVLAAGKPLVIVVLGEGPRTFIAAWFVYGKGTPTDRLSWVKEIPVTYKPLLLKCVEKRLYFVADDTVHVLDAVVRVQHVPRQV
jgi:hypothetical protein